MYVTVSLKNIQYLFSFPLYIHFYHSVFLPLFISLSYLTFYFHGVFVHISCGPVKEY